MDALKTPHPPVCCYLFELSWIQFYLCYELPMLFRTRKLFFNKSLEHQTKQLAMLNRTTVCKQKRKQFSLISVFPYRNRVNYIFLWHKSEDKNLARLYFNDLMHEFTHCNEGIYLTLQNIMFNKKRTHTHTPFHGHEFHICSTLSTDVI